MRKTLIALMFAAALPTVAMAMPEGGPRHDGPHHRGDAPFHQLDLSRDQRQQIGKLMGEQMKQRRDITERYLSKLPAADQKAMKDELQKERAAQKAEWQEFQAWKAEKGNKAQ